MTVVATVLGANWQTLADAFGLGGIYALMAVGIGLVFGVLRLVNFAYGQLVMAGAYALAFAYTHGWPVWVGILLCFGVVIHTGPVSEFPGKVLEYPDAPYGLGGGTLSAFWTPADSCGRWTRWSARSK